jgi:hypothetical protein
VIEDVAADDHLIRLGLRQERLQSRLDRSRRAHERAGQRLPQLRLFHRRGEAVDIVGRRRQLTRLTAAQVDEALLQRGEEPRCFHIGVRGDHIRPDHRVRPVQLLRRLEAAAVELEGLHHRRRREMRGEGERHAQHRRQLRAIKAGPEQPDRYRQSVAGNGADPLSGYRRAEIGAQLRDILRKPVGIGGQVAAQRPRRHHVGAGCAPEAEIDAARKQRLQRAELLRDHQRRVVRQHDPPGADAHRVGGGGDLPDHHRGRGAGDAGHVVVLRQPVAPVFQPLGVTGEVQRVAERVAGTLALRNGR